jgi:hypothetical protein
MLAAQAYQESSFNQGLRMQSGAGITMVIYPIPIARDALSFVFVALAQD